MLNPTVEISINEDELIELEDVSLDFVAGGEGPGIDPNGGRHG